MPLAKKSYKGKRNQGSTSTPTNQGNIKSVAKTVSAMPKAARSSKHGRNVSIGRKG